jgi:hypothetical protein
MCEGSSASSSESTCVSWSDEILDPAGVEADAPAGECEVADATADEGEAVGGEAVGGTVVGVAITATDGLADGGADGEESKEAAGATEHPPTTSPAINTKMGRRAIPIESITRRC